MRLLGIVAVIASIASPVAAADDDRLLLLATSRTGTMQNEINDAAERGYKVLAASRSEDSEVLVVMERTPEHYRYRVIATTRTGTLKKELNDAAEAGYRVVPGGVTTKRSLGDVMRRNSSNQSGVNSEGELLIIMEKGAQTVPGLAYEVLATKRTGTLQKEMSEAVERGYSLVGFISRSEHIAVFERAD